MTQAVRQRILPVTAQMEQHISSSQSHPSSKSSPYAQFDFDQNHTLFGTSLNDPTRQTSSSSSQSSMEGVLDILSLSPDKHTQLLSFRSSLAYANHNLLGNKALRKLRQGILRRWI
eukprot:g8268.t1